VLSIYKLHVDLFDLFCNDDDSLGFMGTFCKNLHRLFYVVLALFFQISNQAQVESNLGVSLKFIKVLSELVQRHYLYLAKLFYHAL